jgi:hypothetical protein
LLFIKWSEFERGSEFLEPVVGIVDHDCDFLPAKYNLLVESFLVDEVGSDESVIEEVWFLLDDFVSDGVKFISEGCKVPIEEVVDDGEEEEGVDEAEDDVDGDGDVEEIDLDCLVAEHSEYERYGAGVGAKLVEVVECRQIVGLLACSESGVDVDD